METQLRLAERQGLLTGPNLSRVQHYALQLLLFADAKQKAQEQGLRFRADLAAAHPELLTDLFPDWFRKVEDEKPAPAEDARLEDIEWGVPTSEDEAQSIEDFLAATMRGTVTADELEEGGWI